MPRIRKFMHWYNLQMKTSDTYCLVNLPLRAWVSPRVFRSALRNPPLSHTAWGSPVQWMPLLRLQNDVDGCITLRLVTLALTTPGREPIARETRGGPCYLTAPVSSLPLQQFQQDQVQLLLADAYLLERWIWRVLIQSPWLIQLISLQLITKFMGYGCKGIGITALLQESFGFLKWGY